MNPLSLRPKVSVIVPVYCVENYVGAAIKSVLQQTYTDFELLIIDDGSPDCSIEVCQQFTDTRIRIIRQTNRGLSGARNAGIRHAKGEYIAFLDSDDCWKPDKLFYHIQHLNSSPHVGVSFSFSEFMTEDGAPMGQYIVAKAKNIDLAHLFRTNPVGNGSAAVFRRKTLDEIALIENRHGIVEPSYYDEDLHRNEDYEILLRISIKTQWKIEGIPEALTLYRINSSGLSSNFEKQLLSWKLVLQKTRNYAPDIIDQFENIGMAYHLRYLARNAVRFHDTSQAFLFIHRALFYHWKLLLEEPRRTLQILAAAYALKFLPARVFANLEILLSKQNNTKLNVQKATC